MTRQQRIENNYFIRLGRQISGDPYLEPQLAMQLGRDRFAGFRGMPSTRPKQFNTLSGDITSVSEDAPLDIQIPENIDAEYDNLMAREVANLDSADYDPNLPNPLMDLADKNREDARSARLLAEYQKPTKLDIPDYPRGNPPLMDQMTVAEDVRSPSDVMMPDPLNPSMSVSPNRPEFNPMTGKVETTPVMPMGPDFEMDIASTPSPTPMADETKGWFDSLKSNFSSNTDAYSDPLLLGGMAIGARDQSPVFPNTPLKGSGSGIVKGALTGAGLGAKTGNPKGALIGAGIGAVAGLLGNFDSQSVEYTPPPQIIRGSGIPFPQASSMDYYKGLI